MDIGLINDISNDNRCRNDLQLFYVDLHIHIGATEKGRPIKISGAKNLTFYNIAKEASERKGIDVVGIIDAHSPSVQEEIEAYLDSGEMVELIGGGLRYGNTTVLLGCELEVKDKGFGAAHLLAYFPTLAVMKEFTAWLKTAMKNVELSSQRIYKDAREVQEKVTELGGLMIPAHAFTPYKSVYGSCSSRIADILDVNQLAGVELGLSSDSEMADYISELTDKTFVSNSDAHSLAKMGREYNLFAMKEPTFEELRKVLHRQDDRQVVANYGLNPRLGKYHRTFCAACDSIIDEKESVLERCIYCGSKKIVRGVMDRIFEVADRKQSQSPAYRPPYLYQVPLEFLPGLGPKKMNRLLEACGTEMNVLHRSSYEQLLEAADESIAAMIIAAREGKLMLTTGGGGVYGKVYKG
jgi:uncharacterized protein (TIGR00375 family)